MKTRIIKKKKARAVVASKLALRKKKIFATPKAATVTIRQYGNRLNPMQCHGSYIRR